MVSSCRRATNQGGDEDVTANESDRSSGSRVILDSDHLSAWEQVAFTSFPAE